MTAIEQQRVAFAIDCIERRFGECTTVDETDASGVKFRDYRAVLQGAGPLIHQGGLVQALAFWCSRPDPHRAVAADVLRWIYRSPLTSGFLNGRLNLPGILTLVEPVTINKGDLAGMVHCLLEIHESNACVENEAIAIISIIKRFAEARYKNLLRPPVSDN